MNFPLCKTKCRPQIDSNPQSSDSKSDALSVPYIDILSENFPLCKTKCRPQRDSNPQSSDSKSDALSVPYIDILSENFPLCKTKCRPQRDSNPQILIRSQTPYPLGHAAMCPVNCFCCLFSCQVLSLILTSFLKNFLCVKQNVDHRGIRTPNLLIRSQTPYPLGHAAMCPVNCVCCLFSCQVLSLILTSFV